MPSVPIELILTMLWFPCTFTHCIQNLKYSQVGKEGCYLGCAGILEALQEWGCGVGRR